MKRYLSLIIVVLLIFTAVSCGRSDNAMNEDSKGIRVGKSEMATESTEESRDDASADFGGMEPASEAEMESEITFSESKNNVPDQRKIIKSANMEVETLEFDRALNLLQGKINAYGGYIESSNVRGTSLFNENSTRNAHYTLRIPSKEFSNFMMDMNTIGNIISQGTFGSDITSQYFDTDAHLKALKIQEDRLLDILRKAEIIEDVISLERELSNVRYEIESLTGSIRRWDNLVDYATLNISIYEVYEITEEVIHPKTLAERISAKFNSSTKAIKEFFEDSTVFAIGTVPFLIFWIPALFILYFVVKKIRKILKTDYIIPTETEENVKK